MKKQMGIFLAAALVAGSLAGCSSPKTEPTTAASSEATTAASSEATTEAATEATTAESESESESTAAASTGYKTGLAVVSSMTSSKDAGEKDGLAQVDSVVAAVIVDGDGKLVKCVIDTAQNKMNFTAEGKVVMNDTFKTKKELGDEYNMKPASGIGKEWFEQAGSLEEYMIGKTADEIKNIAVNEDTVPTDTDLAASVTVKIGSYVEAVAEAMENAQEIGTGEGDKLGLGVVTNMEKSTDATADKEGQCQAYSTYTLVTTDASGKITGAVIDCTQGTVKFDTTGKITSDLTTGVKTKRQLGDDYGMKPASGIGKEWFEQAAAMEAYVVGKTIDEVKGIAVDDDNKPTDADLTASVTMSIGDFQVAMEKAVSNAQ